MDENPNASDSLARKLRIVIIVATALTGMLVVYILNYYPRTDTAVVFANYIGIAPQVDGPITHFYVRENQFVKAGDLLFEIDPRPYQYALERAQVGTANAGGTNCRREPHHRLAAKRRVGFAGQHPQCAGRFEPVCGGGR